MSFCVSSLGSTACSRTRNSSWPCPTSHARKNVVAGIPRLGVECPYLPFNLTHPSHDLIFAQVLLHRVCDRPLPIAPRTRRGRFPKPGHSRHHATPPFGASLFDRVREASIRCRAATPARPAVSRIFKAFLELQC